MREKQCAITCSCSVLFVDFICQHEHISKKHARGVHMHKCMLTALIESCLRSKIVHKIVHKFVHFHGQSFFAPPVACANTSLKH